MAWMRKVDPSKSEGQKDWLKLKAQDSTFSILVIQDHIESIGKANTIKKGVRCCLMRFLLKMLSDMLQNPQLLSHIHISLLGKGLLMAH